MNITLEHIVTALSKAKANLSTLTAEKERDEMEWETEDDELITIAAGAVAALELIVETVAEEITIEEDILRDDKGFPRYGSAGTGKSAVIKKIPNDDEMAVHEEVDDGSIAWPLRDRSKKAPNTEIREPGAVTDEFLDGIMNRPKT